MKRQMLALGILVSLGVSAAPAQRYGSQVPSQAGQAGPRSGLSPYLNLARGGLPAVNYYGLVAPQIQTQQALTQLQFDVQQGLRTPQLGQQQQLQPLTTGHAATYFNLSHYYPVGGFPPRPPRAAGR